MSKYPVIDFLLDDEDSCALTVYSEDNIRIHIIADAETFKESVKPPARATWEEYESLVDATRGIKGEVDGRSGSEPDSAIGLSESPEESKKASARPVNDEEAEEALQTWMLAPIRSHHSLPTQKRHPPTLEEWYNAETHFFNLEIADSGELSAVALEPDSNLKRRIAKLRPEVTLPKYIRDLGLPWYQPSDLVVLAGNDAPPPYHPTQVRIKETGETLFFKAVQGDAPQATKRELSLLHRLGKPDLREKVRAPELKGLVASGRSRTRALGFLQSEIPKPVPLTTKLSTEVAQKGRDRWADDAERMLKVLHEHKIVWGDAKADNLLVDETGALWLIDLGGSYTEGWVDPELKETEEGDDMGTEKIVNALHDPVANTMDPSDQSAQGVKRSASGSPAGERKSPKRGKVAETEISQSRPVPESGAQ